MVGTENLKRIVDQICRDKGIDRALLIDAIEEAVRSAVRKKYGNRRIFYPIHKVKRFWKT